MHSLWPLPAGQPADELSDSDLEALYAYPQPLQRPWVQANFVSSADGAVTLSDRSEGLSHPADKRIFTLGRDLADVVLVGAGTVEVEDYKGVKPTERRLRRRQRLGLSRVPPIAVVSGRCTVKPDAALFTQQSCTAPIVITTEVAPAERKGAIAEAGAELIVAGAEEVDLPLALSELSARGLRRINCEGGPHLLGSLLAADLIDQLCLTVAPLLAGAGAGRISQGSPGTPRHMRLASILHEDGFCMFRYTREQPE